MQKILLILITLYCGYSLPGFAYEQARAEQNFSHELVICSAYFSIAAEGSKRTGNEVIAENLNHASELFLENARHYNEDKTILARLQLALKEQIDLIDKDYANLSVLNIKYLDLCSQLLKTPQARFDYWLQKND